MDEFLESYSDIELTEYQQAKLLGHIPSVNEKIEIFWSDREFPDKGYTFKLPNQEEDDSMLDLWLHVTKVDNSDEMDKTEDIWIHLKELLTIERVEQLKFYL